MPGPEKKKKRKPLVEIGWREVMALPEWGVDELLLKVDTGARTSALDVANIEELPGDRVRFEVVVSRGDRRVRQSVEAAISRRSRVRSSNGHLDERLFVITTVRLGPVETEVEFSLVCRKHMLCRVLLGRKALAGNFLVNCRRRYLLGKPRSIHTTITDSPESSTS